MAREQTSKHAGYPLLAAGTTSPPLVMLDLTDSAELVSLAIWGYPDAADLLPLEILRASYEPGEASLGLRSHLEADLSSDSSVPQCLQGDHRFPLGLNNLEVPLDRRRKQDTWTHILLKTPPTQALLHKKMAHVQRLFAKSLSPFAADRRSKLEHPRVATQQILQLLYQQ